MSTQALFNSVRYSMCPDSLDKPDTNRRNRQISYMKRYSFDELWLVHVRHSGRELCNSPQLQYNFSYIKKGGAKRKKKKKIRVPQKGSKWRNFQIGLPGVGEMLPELAAQQ